MPGPTTKLMGKGVRLDTGYRESRSKKVKIGWFVKHWPTKAQSVALKNLVQEQYWLKHGERLSKDDIAIVNNLGRFTSATDIVSIMKNRGLHDLVLEGPWSIYQDLAERGCFPLYSEGHFVRQSSSASDDPQKGEYLFDRYVRIRGLRIVEEPMKPMVSPQSLMRLHYKVLRASWNTLTEEEEHELEWLFGEDLIIVPKSQSEPEDFVYREMATGSYYAVVTKFSPLSTLSRYLERGYIVLRALYEDRVEDSSEMLPNTSESPKYGNFLGFMRVYEITLIKEEV